MKRKYYSPRREAQALQTRKAILDAAFVIFSRRGYEATTIESIANEANVSPETVYAIFKNKFNLLDALVNRSVGAYDRPLKLSFANQLPKTSSTQSDTLIDIFAIEITNLLDSFSELLVIIRNAGNTDTNIKEMYDSLLLNWRNSVKSLLNQSFSGDDEYPDVASDESLIDAIWALSSWDVYHLLIYNRYWSKSAYRTWLSESIKQQLKIFRRTHESNT